MPPTIPQFTADVSFIKVLVSLYTIGGKYVAGIHTQTHAHSQTKITIVVGTPNTY